ncbi:nitroreductase family protein, partial [bacterium]|nr:nitroreductase family protein [bacterium]
MNVIEAIKQRRAVKHYDPDFTLPQQDFDLIMEAALNAPTSFNIQNWRFIRVRDKETRKQLRAAAWDQAQVTDASELLILCADLKSWEKSPERYWRNAPKDVQDFMVPAIDDFYRGHDWLQRDEAMRSVGLVGQTIMLTAKSLGYDTCPMVGFDQEAVAKIIQLPDDH